MKKTLLALIASLLVAVSAQAATYSDTNNANVWLNQWNTSYTGQFTLAGYNPAVETITSANAVFTFWDAPIFGGSESFVVSMGGDGFSQGSFSGSLTVGETILNAWGILDSTGVLSYTISRTSGEFWLDTAKLTAQSTSRGGNTEAIGQIRNVPDAGATSVLLGLGVLAMVGARRRFASAA